MSELKNCGECSHGKGIPIKKKSNKAYLFFCLKQKRKKDLYAALNCPDWDGKGGIKGWRVTVREDKIAHRIESKGQGRRKYSGSKESSFKDQGEPISKEEKLRGARETRPRKRVMVTWPTEGPKSEFWLFPLNGKKGTIELRRCSSSICICRTCGENGKHKDACNCPCGKPADDCTTDCRYFRKF